MREAQADGQPKHQRKASKGACGVLPSPRENHLVIHSGAHENGSIALCPMS